MRSFFLSLLLLIAPSVVSAAPKFGGLKQALPAPGAVVLQWERATAAPNGGTVRYRIYVTENGKRRLLAETSGTDYSATGLVPGRAYKFEVRAKDKTGEDKNRVAKTVRPTDAFPAREWRGVWISRFEWAKGTGSEITARLRRMMRNLGAGNFNAVVFPVRGQGDTLYPSKLEPWSELIPGDLRDEDPTALAIAEARRNGLEFHAWFNLLVVWQDKQKRHPSAKNHPFYTFANPSDPARRKGVIHDAARKPVYFGDSDYTWLTPGNPAVELHARRVVLDFIARYDVDGIHWDDRTAMPNGASHDPVSLQRFRGRGNPDGISDLREWQRDQLSRILSNIYVAATARKASLLVSASPFGIYDKNRVGDGYGRFKDCVHDFNTDGERWLRDGSIDALMPQIYWAEGDPTPNYARLVRDWLSNNRSGRPIWPGSALGNYGGTQPLATVQRGYVALTRALGAGGNTFFSYSAATDAEWAAAAKTLYPRKAAVPRPLHKVQPATGQLQGTVRDTKGRPVLDAWIRLPGRKYTYLSAEDGFFAIPSIPPGTHTVECSVVPGKWVRRNVTIRAGSTAQTEFNVP